MFIRNQPSEIQFPARVFGKTLADQHFRTQAKFKGLHK